MGSIKIDRNEFLEYLIKNSIFTSRQISIIYNRRQGKRDGSRSTYYRVLYQGRNNVRRVLYSIMLLEILGVIDEEKKSILNRLIKQVSMLSNLDGVDLRDVTRIIDEVTKRLSSI